jgi:hypothetical protein
MAQVVISTGCELKIQIKNGETMSKRNLKIYAVAFYICTCIIVIGGLILGHLLSDEIALNKKLQTQNVALQKQAEIQQTTSIQPTGACLAVPLTQCNTQGTMITETGTNSNAIYTAGNGCGNSITADMQSNCSGTISTPNILTIIRVKRHRRHKRCENY